MTGFVMVPRFPSPNPPFWQVWREKESVQIHIDTIFVVLQSTSAQQLSVEQLCAAERQNKRALLKNWEAQLDSSFAAGAATHAEAQSHQTDGEKADGAKQTDGDKKNASLFAAILDKLEVSITGVTFCYYDSISNQTFGASIDSFGFSCEPNTPTACQTTKCISMQGFSVFLDNAGMQHFKSNLIYY